MSINIINITLLIIGYLFTFVIPGMYVVETFFEGIPSRFKLPLYMLLSVMISTYFVYFLSLILGFSRYSILVSASFFTPWLLLHFKKNCESIYKVVRNNVFTITFAILVFLIYLIALYPGIFTNFNGYIVMSSSNWQDTAMHAGIIESISQGNFPPQAPYFSGVPLNYYYFTDFHSSIIETLYGQFFPRVIVYDNSLFAMIFFLSVYLLTYEITKNKKISIFSSLAATFYGSLMYINFIKDVFSSDYGNKLKVGIDLLRNNSYAIEFGKFFQISPMADYFLQNRPMMVGLSAVVMILSLTIYLYKKQKYELMILPGVICAMLLKFQFFAFVVSIFIFVIVTIFNLNRNKKKEIIKSILLFMFVPILFLSFFSSASKINNQSLLVVIRDNFKFSPWEEGKNISWYILFLIANLGIPLIISIVLLPILILSKKIDFKKLTRIGPVLILGILLSIIPLMCRFTIMKYDMLKFYYFSEIFLSITCFYFLSKFIKNKILFLITSTVTLLFIVPTSFTNLANSYLNKTMAYSIDEINAGYWIRENTPQKSVFIDLANLHSPITEVGGRLRVLSYINWPHSHGYNIGEDNVFTRLDDIRSIYGGLNISDFQFLVDKYKVDYIYYGNTENNEFPDSQSVLDNNFLLKKVYYSNDIKIYKVVKNLPSQKN